MNSDLKVVIDAGHGGSDPGTVGNGVVEKELNLAISQYMLERFRTLGIPATLIRTTDETISPDERVKRVLESYGNNPNVVVISNHINAAGPSQQNAEGAEVIYSLRNDSMLARNILQNLGKAGQVTRTYYQRRLPNDPTKDYYFILRNTGNTEPVLIEYGFITNKEDIERVQRNYKRYVDAVVNGVIETFIPNAGMGITYMVKSGDTLWNIAKRYNTSVENIKNLNNLNNDLLSIGQMIQIPTGTEISGAGNNYVVKPGDTLWSIAQMFNTTVDNIRRLNNLSDNLLSIGQILKIPSEIEISEGKFYTVRPGDSLWSIAQQFDTTVDDIMNLNNLTSNILTIGQLLKIPNSNLAGTGAQYIVKSGDTLWSIAQRYSTTVDNIRRLNNLTSDNLQVGQVLFI